MTGRLGAPGVARRSERSSSAPISRRAPPFLSLSPPDVPLPPVTFPRKSGHRVLCGFCLCLLWSDVADGGVDPRTIIIAFDISEQFAPRGIAIGVFAVWTSSVFRVPKKLSIGALSQQFA